MKWCWLEFPHKSKVKKHKGKKKGREEHIETIRDNKEDVETMKGNTREM